MVYQDHLTKFVLLRALQSKRATEVAYQLNYIFLTIGAPCILQSEDGREFVNNVTSELASLWPELKIVHGKPRRSQSQDSVERANQDIEIMIGSWMKDNVTKKRVEGLRYVQFMKNRAYHSVIKQSPYKALFGIEPRVQLLTSSLPQEIINYIQDKDDLRKVTEDYCNDNLAEGSDDNVADVSNQEKVSSSEKVSSTENDIRKARTTAAENLVKQAKKMKATSDKSPPANIGDNVTKPIPDVDKGKGDLRNTIGVILQKNDEGETMFARILIAWANYQTPRAGNGMRRT
ncbi:KRAB-A domain-containing protein 2 [Eumeta japonica]|uniref:KRAB-A domain-containing protein 2 n=1 Tax=Eumeta variegata TaxID=151549 RepID=A0A4C1V6K7_EUMVA|nr:KRAB-A domain-containing protein 2 [Eumeta japonica]